MTTILPWLLSACTIAVMWLAGNGSRWAWYLGIAIQPFWVAFALATGAYGLIALSLALTLVYGRNLWRWYDNRADEERLRRARQVQREKAFGQIYGRQLSKAEARSLAGIFDPMETNFLERVLTPEEYRKRVLENGPLPEKENPNG